MIKIREKFIRDRAGHKKSVVIPYRTYENLLEDLHDLAVIAERKNEKTINLDTVKKKLKKDGLI